MRREQHHRRAGVGRIVVLVVLVVLVRQRLHTRAVGIPQVGPAGQRSRNQRAVLEGRHRLVEVVGLRWHLYQSHTLGRRMRASSFHLALRRKLRPVGRILAVVYLRIAGLPLAHIAPGPGIPEAGSLAGCLPF